MLDHADVPLLLNLSIARLSTYVLNQERETGELIRAVVRSTTWADS